MNKALEISEVDKFSGEDFERFLIKLLKEQGYNEIKGTPSTCDYGADLLAIKDGIRFAIQVKRSMNAVSISAVQEVLGGMIYYGAEKGMVITNAFYSESAKELAKRASIELVDRKIIKKWLERIKMISAPGIITPRTHQYEALKNLSLIREKGESRALVVMASGLGKTYLAALDAHAFQAEQGTPIRILYLSHQAIILEQAHKSFTHVFGENRSYGRFDGDIHQLNPDIIFGTFQSIYRSLDLFEPSTFDYVVVDEAHHTAAPTRDKVVGYLKPKFVLGLTATPFRGDGKDIYTYYNDVVAISLQLEKALACRLLTPIDYRVISDKVNPEALALNLLFTSKLSKQKLFQSRSDTEIVNMILNESSKISSFPKIIVFCASLKQMDHFSMLFPNCRDVSGRDSRKRQISILEDFLKANSIFFLQETY